MSDTEVVEALPPDASIQQIYKWSTWVHVGPGAEDCDEVHEDTGEVECANPLHFHAWCRLPNQYQHREIRETALAAKARRIRQYRDPDSNASIVLDMEIDELAAQGDAGKEAIVTELVGRDWWRDYMEAQLAVLELEDEDEGEKLYEHIERDMQRWREIAMMDEEDRPADEFGELEKHIAAYNKAMDDEQRKIREPREQALADRDLNDLLDDLRKQRVDVASNEEFSHEYATLEWLHCTLRKPEGAPVFASRELLTKADASVLDALKATYLDLERTQREGGGPGNS